MQTQQVGNRWNGIVNCIASRVIAVIFLAGLVQQARATIVTDSFDRPDAYTLGSNWDVKTYGFGISANKAYNLQFWGPGMAMYQGTSVGTLPFSVQANVSAPTAGDWAGLAFNIQDAANYYLARWRQDGYYQIMGGGLFVQGSTPFVTGSLMRVTGDGVGNFQLALGTTPVYFSNTTYVGGGLGIYSAATAYRDIAFDNFSAEYAVPEPAVMTLICLGGLLIRTKSWRRTSASKRSLVPVA